MTRHDGPLIGERDGLRVMACHACGFAHLEMLPDAAALMDYYANDFWREKPRALECMEEQRGWWHAIYDDWMDCIEQYVTGRDLLDMGAGYGFFVDAAHERGWNPWGIEPSRAACEYADKKLGWQLFNGSWEDWDYSWEFDFMSALWLIEHLPDPLRFLHWCHARLNEGGVLLLVTPNDFSRNQEQANKTVTRPYWWIDKTHLNYLTPVTLANLLGRAGFRVADHLTMFPMELFLLNGHDYTVDDEIGRRCHKRVERFDLRMRREERIALYRRWARAGMGREIVFVAIKDA